MTDTSNDPRPLAGRTALVTGAGRGIGRALALGLSAAGVSVVAVARSADQLQDMARAAAGPEPRLVSADLADRDHITDLLRDIVELGRIDILINNAAVVEPLGPSHEIDATAFVRALDLNLAAPALLTCGLLPAMLNEGWGRVVNISSGAAGDPAGMVRANAYVTSKSALEAHTLNLAAELSGTGVTVNAYRPGLVDTGMQGIVRGQDPAHIGGGLRDRFLDYQRSGSLITPEESAAGLIRRLRHPDNGRIWSTSAPE